MTQAELYSHLYRKLNNQLLAKSVYSGIASVFSEPFQGLSFESLGRFLASGFFRKQAENASSDPRLIGIVCMYYLSLNDPVLFKPLTFPRFPVRTPLAPQGFKPWEILTSLRKYLRVSDKSTLNPGDFLLTYSLFLTQAQLKTNSIQTILKVYYKLIRQDRNNANFTVLLFLITMYFTKIAEIPSTLTTGLIFNAVNKRNMSSIDLLSLIFELYIDNRYKPSHLRPLFALLSTCIERFFPKRSKQIPKIMRLLSEFIRVSDKGNSEYIKDVFTKFIENPYLDLKDWVTEGARLIRIYGDSSRKVSAFFNLESDQSKDLWKQADTGIYFESVRERLYFFCNALTEQKVMVKNSQAFPIEGQQDVFYTDGKSIFIPPYIKQADDRQTNDVILLHSVAHECAHIEFHSFLKDETRYKETSKIISRQNPGWYSKNIDAMKSNYRIIRQQLINAGYSVKGGQVIESQIPFLTRLIYHVEFPKLLQDLWNIIEDSRVDALLYHKYAGFAGYKETAMNILIEDMRSLDECDGLTHIITALVQKILIGEQKGSIKKQHKDVVSYGLSVYREFSSLAGPDTYDSIQYASKIYSLIIRVMEKHFPELMSEARKKQSAGGFSLIDLNIDYTSDNADLPLEIQAIKEEIAESGIDDADTDAVEKTGKKGFTESVEQDLPMWEGMKAILSGKIYTYPEWDFNRGTYIHDKCKLGEVSIKAWENEQVDDLRTPYSGFIEQTKRAFRWLRPEEFTELRGMEDGDELDFDRYIDSLLDFYTGHEMDNNFYIQRRRNQREVLAALALDMSPSTAEPTGNASVWLYQKYAALMLSEAMYSIDDYFGLFSFFDYSEERCFFCTLKDFAEPYGKRHENLLCKFQPAKRGFSRLAVGLRHIISSMKEYDVKTKVIFFITDGKPIYIQLHEDEGKYSDTVYIDGKDVKLDKPVRVVPVSEHSRPYTQADMQKAYEEARLAGIHLFCICLSEEALEYMKKIFGTSLIYLPDISELPGRLAEIFRKITK